MSYIRPSKIGLMFAVLLGSWHMAWVLLVMVGWAQPLIDFIFRLHFVRPVYVIEEFNPGLAVALIAVTASIGYVMGWMAGVLWNKLQQE